MAELFFDRLENHNTVAGNYVVTDSSGATVFPDNTVLFFELPVEYAADSLQTIVYMKPPLTSNVLAFSEDIAAVGCTKYTTYPLPTDRSGNYGTADPTLIFFNSNSEAVQPSTLTQNYDYYYPTHVDGSYGVCPTGIITVAYRDTIVKVRVSGWIGGG